MSAVLQQKFDGRRRCNLNELAVVCSSGEQGASWQAMENARERPVHTGNVRVFSFESLKAMKFVKEGEKEKQEGVQGQ